MMSHVQLFEKSGILTHWFQPVEWLIYIISSHIHLRKVNCSRLTGLQEIHFNKRED